MKQNNNIQEHLSALFTVFIWAQYIYQQKFYL